jgi:hypothetical protein
MASVGKETEVVEEGLRKSLPDKLYIIHTKDESDHSLENEANKLKTKIEAQHHIPTELSKVGAFDMDQIIKTILE